MGDTGVVHGGTQEGSRDGGTQEGSRDGYGGHRRVVGMGDTGG